MVCFPDHNNVVKEKRLLKRINFFFFFTKYDFYDQITDQNMLGI